MKKNIFRYPLKNINSSSNISNVNVRGLYQKLKNKKSIQNTHNNNNFLTLYPLSTFLSMDFKNNKKYTSYLPFQKSLKNTYKFNSFKTISTYDNLLTDSKHNYILNKVKMLKKLVSTPFISSKNKSNIHSYFKSKNNFASQGLLSSIPDKKYKNQRNNKVIDLKRNAFDLNSNDFSKISKNENFFSSEISDSLDTSGNCLLYDEICSGQLKNLTKNNIPLNSEENLTIPNLITENNINEKKEDEEKAKSKNKDINKKEEKNENKDNIINNNGLSKENYEFNLNKNNDKFKDFDDILNEEKNKKIEYNTIYQNKSVEKKQKTKKVIKTKDNKNSDNQDDNIYKYNKNDDFGKKDRELLNDKNNINSSIFSDNIKNENKENIENVDSNKFKSKAIDKNKNINKYVNDKYPNNNRKYINLDFNTMKSGGKKNSRNKKLKIQENPNSKNNVCKCDFSGNNFFTEKPKNKFVSKINNNNYLYSNYIKKFKAYKYFKDKNTLDMEEIFSNNDENKNTIKYNNFFGNNILYNSSVKPPNFLNTFEFK